jgi:hypothetical protein
VVEGLHIGVHLPGEALLGSLEHKVERGLVARLSEGAVAAIVSGDLVEVP